MSVFESNIISIYREKGELWLAELPKHVQELADLWGLSQLKPLDNLSYNYVLSGYQKKTPIVLKLSLDICGLDKEAKALESFSGYGAISVLARTNDSLLLQRAVPGNPLKGALITGTQKPIEIACQVMEGLHKAPLPNGNHFPHIQDWLAALDQEWGLPKAHIQRARELRNQLLQTQTSPVLLHGDLHQENILSNGDDWLVIDPKGVIGFPINEIWACVEDPRSDLECISRYFNFDFDEVVKWYYVQTILAACWQVEDNLDPKRFLELVQPVLPLMRG